MQQRVQLRIVKEYANINTSSLHEALVIAFAYSPYKYLAFNLYIEYMNQSIVNMSIMPNIIIPYESVSANVFDHVNRYVENIFVVYAAHSHFHVQKFRIGGDVQLVNFHLDTLRNYFSIPVWNIG